MSGDRGRLTVVAAAAAASWLATASGCADPGASAPAAATSAPAREASPQIAVVNGLAITMRDLAAERARYGSDVERPADADLVEHLIERAVVAQEARRLGFIEAGSPIDVTSDAQRVAGERAMQSITSSRVSDDEVRAHWQAQRSRYGEPARRRTQQVVEPVRPNAPAADVEAARKRLEAERGALSRAAPDAFANAARASERRVLDGPLGKPYRQHKNDPQMRLDRFTYMADTGLQSRADLAGFWGEAFAEIVFATAVGQIPPPVQTPWGWHLVRVVEEAPAVDRPFEEVRDQVRSELSIAEARQWIAELVAAATVEWDRDAPIPDSAGESP